MRAAARTTKAPRGGCCTTPLVYQTDAGDVTRLVGSVMQADVMPSYAYDRLRIGAQLPVYLFASGNDVSAAGLGDIAADAKVTVLDGEAAPVEVAIDGRLSLPTHTVDLALGDPSVGWELSAIASREIGPVLLAANLGTRGGPVSDLENVRLNDAFLFRVGGGYAVTEDAGVSLEAAGRVFYASGDAAGTPVEGLLGGYGRVAESVVVRGGAGMGVTEGVGAPDFRLLLGVGWEPRGPKAPKDTDLDGITDDVDGCPLEPEDVDTFEDSNGCPDIDNDADGILDAADTCPLEPEDKDGWQDDEGCPDPNTQVTVRITDMDGNPIDLAKGVLKKGDTVVDTSGQSLARELAPSLYVFEGSAGTYSTERMEFEVVNGPPVELQLFLEKQKDVKINFETAKAVIKPDSFGLLDQAVKILVDYPEIRKLRIEGHTDSRGSDTYNLKLSSDRAASVMKYFIDKGVDPNRLTSQGFGESKPLDPANNEAAWTKNRRVDFFIELWDDEAGKRTIEVKPE